MGVGYWEWKYSYLADSASGSIASVVSLACGWCSGYVKTVLTRGGCVSRITLGNILVRVGDWKRRRMD